MKFASKRRFSSDRHRLNDAGMRVSWLPVAFRFTRPRQSPMAEGRALSLFLPQDSVSRCESRPIELGSSAISFRSNNSTSRLCSRPRVDGTLSNALSLQFNFFSCVRCLIARDSLRSPLFCRLSCFRLCIRHVSRGNTVCGSTRWTWRETQALLPALVHCMRFPRAIKFIERTIWLLFTFSTFNCRNFTSAGERVVSEFPISRSSSSAVQDSTALGTCVGTLHGEKDVALMCCTSVQPRQCMFSTSVVAGFLISPRNSVSISPFSIVTSSCTPTC